MDIRQEVHNTIWGATNIPNRMPEEEINDVIAAMVDLIEHIVDANREATLDAASYDAERAAHLEAHSVPEFDEPALFAARLIGWK